MSGNALVIGAGGTIGNAVARRLAETEGWHVIGVGRSDAPPTGWKIPEATDSKGSGPLTWQVSDHSEASISTFMDSLFEREFRPSIVVIATGILHDDDVFPEKRIEDLNMESLRRVFEVNTFLPALWLKHLLPFAQKLRLEADICALSARVGSIGDNRLGGWYSYRASKSALNMLLQTAAIEYSRRAPGCKLTAFHPGTTDSPLSKPFQKSVPDGKLFNADFVAEKLLSVLAGRNPEQKVAYVDWAGKEIPW